MKTKSLNIIVRDALLDSGLPLHYYTRYLHHGLRILDELSLDFNMGNIKTATLAVTDYQRAVLPSDYIDMIDVSAKHGERLLPLERERNLNKKYNYDSSGNKIPYPTATSINYDSEINYNLISGVNNMNSRGELIGRYYGRMRAAKLTYDIDETNQEIVFGNEMLLTEITLTYITSAVSKSAANVVNPYATDVITKYIVMMAAKAEGATLGKSQLAKQDYDNSRRVFRARLNSMDYAELLGAIRRGIIGSLKN
jgi:uncharacterized protein (UPF0333 family)